RRSSADSGHVWTHDRHPEALEGWSATQVGYGRLGHFTCQSRVNPRLVPSPFEAPPAQEAGVAPHQGDGYDSMLGAVGAAALRSTLRTAPAPWRAEPAKL